jgi:hypothetical protein
MRILAFWLYCAALITLITSVNNAIAQIGQASPHQMTVGQPVAPSQLIDPCGPHGIDCSTKTVPGITEEMAIGHPNPELLNRITPDRPVQRTTPYQRLHPDQHPDLHPLMTMPTPRSGSGNVLIPGGVLK